MLAVGAATAADAGLFGADTVWSQFGAGYGYGPLALPLAGLTVRPVVRQRRVVVGFDHGATQANR